MLPVDPENSQKTCHMTADRFQHLVESNKLVKNNDAVLWTWFTFGLLYFFVVFGAIATAEPIKFDEVEDKVGVVDGNGKSVK